MKLDKFTRAYIECLMWSETDECREDGGDPIDQNYDVCDLAPCALEEIVKDCVAFQEENWDLIAHDLTQAGHDFCLTRNGHGAGFWDGKWGDVGDELTDRSKPYGTMGLYVGDDGLVYIHN